MRELRTAVMIRVEASWADSNGALRTAIARMEDKSLSGACIRLNLPIQVGTKLWVQWRFEEFSGIAKYCRSEGAEYVVGIRRDKDHRPFPGRATKIEVTPRPAVKTDEGGISAPRIHPEVQCMPEPLEKAGGQTPPFCSTPSVDSLSGSRGVPLPDLFCGVAPKTALCLATAASLMLCSP